MTARAAFLFRDSCPACRCPQGSIEVDLPFGNGPVGEFIRLYYRVDPHMMGEARYRLVRCGRCTLLYQAWVGDPELLARLYGEWIEDSEIPERDPTYRQMIARPLESRDAHEIMTAAAFLGKAPEQLRTLDYGMGWALWARTAVRLGCRSSGTELSPGRLAFARSHGVECLTDEELQPDSFDFINTEQVMEHLPELRETAERLARALSRGGVLKISVPDAKGVEPVLRSLRAGRLPGNAEIMPIQPLEHVNGFTKTALAEFAGELGLRTVRPSMMQRYAFMRVRGGWSVARARNSLKELVRPLVQWRNPRNLYVWLQKP
jgi:SAM-dependent methyltransferase